MAAISSSESILYTLFHAAFHSPPDSKSLTPTGRRQFADGILTPVRSSSARFSDSGQKLSQIHVGRCHEVLPHTSGWPWMRQPRPRRKSITGSTAGRRQCGCSFGCGQLFQKFSVSS